MSNGGYVAVMVIDLQLPDAGSLKAKRQQVIDYLKGRWGPITCAQSARSAG